jgi:putative flippase GtrA
MSEFFTTTFLFKFLKFVAVGASGLFVDFGVTYLCKEVFKIQKYISNSIGFTVAASTNYILNRIWTFQSKDPEIGVEYTEFLVISLIGLGLNNFFLWLIIKRLKLNFYLAKLIAIGLVTIWNFLANYFITFA